MSIRRGRGCKADRHGLRRTEPWAGRDDRGSRQRDRPTPIGLARAQLHWVHCRSRDPRIPSSFSSPVPVLVLVPVLVRMSGPLLRPGAHSLHPDTAVMRSNEYAYVARVRVRARARGQVRWEFAFPYLFGWGVMRRYGMQLFVPLRKLLGDDLGMVIDGTMITSPPSFQLAGVATEWLSVS